MLWAIPDLKYAMLNGSDVCCGGAGVYNLVCRNCPRKSSTKN